MRDSTGYSLPHRPNALHLIYALRSTNRLVAHTTEAFLQDTWRHVASHGLFNVTAGVRLTHRDWNNETFVSPRLSVGYIPEWNDRWTLRAATGLYYQRPSIKNCATRCVLTAA